MEKRVAVNVDGSYDRVRFSSNFRDSYSASLILSDRKERKVADIEIEPTKPWVGGVRVSGNVLRRR